MDNLPMKKGSERQEIVYLFKCIKEYYDKFEVTTDKVNSWYAILKDYDFNTLHANLINHVSNSSYAPKIKDLIGTKKPEDIGRSIPGVEETQKLLQEYEEKRNKVANDSTAIAARDKAKEEIKKILGLK